MTSVSLDLTTLRRAYRTGTASPHRIVRELYARIRDCAANPIWITLVPETEALAYAATLESVLTSDMTTLDRLPLFGVPFAVKDNIDVAGLPTTAACREFAYVAARHATCVQRLIDAGAILIGKTNLDQFATGLVGTRSPYGAVRSAFDPRYVSGGSSSGSAVAVALGLVSFALGTDTAGSGRVPAGFNNIVGLKPTRGLVSTTGLVPACRSLDCVSVFALTARDAREVFDVLNAFDHTDDFAREVRSLASQPFDRFRFGVPGHASLEFFGDLEYEQLFGDAIEQLAWLGGTPVEVDLAPFFATAKLLYDGPWVAERYAALREFAEAQPDALHPITRRVISDAHAYSAADVFSGQYRLAALKRATAAVWHEIDALALPTAGTTYTIEEVESKPFALNANLGRYTNFVNLLDLAAIAVPSGFRRDGLPFGITLIAPALSDAWLCALAERYHRCTDLSLGALGTPMPEPVPLASAIRSDTVRLAVVGAHLSGQPLNHQLTNRGAQFVRTCRTAAAYSLYALPGSKPPKPGLVRNGGGAAIEVEVWEMPAEGFGPFVAAIPAPLGIGTLELEDGDEVKGFLCESYATERARDISSFGGWRNYLAAHSDGRI
jgi:allophanate hydrolase